MKYFNFKTCIKDKGTEKEWDFIQKKDLGLTYWYKIFVTGPICFSDINH